MHSRVLAFLTTGLFASAVALAQITPAEGYTPQTQEFPLAIKIGQGELRFGTLLQAWYFGDTTPGMSNTFRIRRAEIKLYGTVIPGWEFLVMADPAKTQSFVAGGDPKILQDLLVIFSGLKGHQFALGQTKIVLTEEGVHSSADLDFAERAIITRTFSDRREAGFFYKGDYGKLVTGWLSITNGTRANVLANSNDTVLTTARLDLKPFLGVLVGASGSYSSGEGPQHLTRTRTAAHLRYDGPAYFPLGLRFEYLEARDGQIGKSDLRQRGFYATALYTFEKHYQLAVRYESFDPDRDVSGNMQKVFTAGLHYLVSGKNINLKADYSHLRQEDRKVNGLPDTTFNQFTLAAQVSF